MAFDFVSKRVPSNADMPCDRRIYEFRDFKSDSWQKLQLHNNDIVVVLSRTLEKCRVNFRLITNK